jgi:uncharacterized protein YjbJ (UPF0337 family)
MHKETSIVSRSARKDSSSGVVDRVAGRAAEAWGAVTGNRKTKAKGKASRLRGQGRTAKGRFKRRSRRSQR